MKNKKIINGIICIILILILILIIAIVLNRINIKNNEMEKSEFKDQEKLKEEFNLIFDNEIHGETTIIQDSDKIYEDKEEIVYNAYKNKDIKNDEYEIDVNIPVINLKSEDAYKNNDLTQQIFVDKINEIYENVKNYTIYTVEYTAFINNSILSLIIKSTIKEGSNPQRTIFQTYNLNLETKEEVSFNDIIDECNLKKEKIKEKIDFEIKKQIIEDNKIHLTGYETFTREPKSQIYEVKNIENFFIGKDNRIFVLFAYGNNQFTSEFDIIEI